MTKEITGWEIRFDDLKKGFLSTVNGEWWASDEDFIKRFIGNEIASAVEAREREITSEIKKWKKRGSDGGQYTRYSDALDDLIDLINPSKE